MFRVEIERFGGLDLYKIKDSESCFSTSFIPDAGGILNDFICDVDGKRMPVIEGYADAKELLDTYAFTFKSAKLSPYPNRIKKGEYSFNDHKYQVTNNFKGEANSIHGLVYNKFFKVEKLSCVNDHAELVLTFRYNKDEDGYPFQYKLTIEYILEKNKLSCATIIENTDTKNIPIGDGWHPYFTLGRKIDHLDLQLQDCLSLDEKDLIPTGSESHYRDFSTFKGIGKTNFDSCFRILGDSPKAEIKLRDAEKNMMLSIWQEAGQGKYRYFQLYTPPSRSCIAIEPMSCPPNAFNSKKDLILLEPKQKINLSWGFEIAAL